jgi:phage-related protein
VNVRQDAGRQLLKVQRGDLPDDCKPIREIGMGVEEIRIWEATGTFRILYVAKFADAIYVLHAFQKKTQQTSQRDKEIARSRFKELMRSES